MLDLTTRYPTQVISGDPDYPYGKARNRTSEVSNDGTPFEADIVNDIYGAFQAILSAAGSGASGTPERVGSSNVLSSIQTIATTIAQTWATKEAASFQFTTGAAGTEFAIEEGGTLGRLGLSAGGYSIESGVILVAPYAANYCVEWGAALTSDSASAGIDLGIMLEVNATGLAYAGGRRQTTSTSEPVYVHRSHRFPIAGPSLNVIKFKPVGTGNLSVVNGMGFQNNVCSIQVV